MCSRISKGRCDVAEIIACRRGLVTSMPGCRGTPGKIKLNPTFEPMAAIIEAINTNQSVNVQFQPSLGGPVYVYVFGDNMGDISIMGTAFAGMCDDSSHSGLKEIFDYYNANRASQRQEVVTVTYGSESLEGFLTRMTLQPLRTSDILSRFSLVINTLPKEN